MNMAFVQSTAVNLFDQYRLLIPPKLKSHQDGPPGQRVLFITDKKESFTVSFEEGMQMRDMLAVSRESANAVSHQCCKDGKYIHQRRGSGATERCAFFHIELEDDDGKTLYLSGQLVVEKGYQWADGVEPVLMNLLEGITVC
jgi:hypothetical protein